MKPATLVKSIRNGLVEREHAGFILCIDDKKRTVFQAGEPEEYACFLRSCAKPFQAIPILMSQAFKTYNFTLSELAVCCASHTGSALHTDTIKGIFKKLGLTKEALKCGIHAPLDKETKINLSKENIPYSEYHNNCSGKHTGMLAVCLKKGWNLENYLASDHPLQLWIRALTKEYCELTEKEYNETLDGCGTPVGGMTLQKMVYGYLNLLRTAEGKTIIRAFQENPLLIGGVDRLDSLIINISEGNLMAKVGAEGLCIVLNPSLNQCLLVKIMDANMHARSIATIEALKKLGWIDENKLNLHEVKNNYNPELVTLQGYKTGEVKAVF